MKQEKAYKKFAEETRWLSNNNHRKDISTFANDTLSDLFILINYGCVSVNFYDMFVRRVASAMHVNSIYDIP